MYSLAKEENNNFFLRLLSKPEDPVELKGEF